MLVFGGAKPSHSFADVVQFESLPLPASQYNNGSVFLSAEHRAPFTVTSEGDNLYGDYETQQYFSTEGVAFGNSYAYGSFNGQTYDYWSGWSWSAVSNTSDGSYLNQYASWTGGGSDGTGGGVSGQSYAIAFGDSAWFNIPENAVLESLDLSNTTYAAKTMLEGINGGKKFGGSSGNDADYFSVTFHGFDGIDEQATEVASETFYLADYRFDDSALDYVLDQWETVQLTGFEGVRQVRLSFDGSDTSTFGLVTPAYLAIDRLQFSAVPEPTTGLVLGALSLAFGLVRRRK